jgi:hypothetical protein
MISPDIDQKRTEQTEQIKPEDFLFRLYDKISQYLIQGGGQVKKEFGPQTIEKWQDCVEFIPDYLPLKLIKAVLIADTKKDFVLVLGRGRHSRHSEETLRLQFGFFPTGHEIAQPPSISDLRYFVNQPLRLSPGKGEFYEMFGSIFIMCWANDWPYGGKELDRSPDSRKELLTTKGLEDSLEMVRRILRNANYPKDLT